MSHHSLVLLPAVLFSLALQPASARSEWLPNGTPIAGPGTAAADGVGGVIVGSNGSLATRAARLTGAGDNAPGWPPDGRWFGNTTLGDPLMVADGQGGAFVVFRQKCCGHVHASGDPTELRIQYVTSSGAIAEGWGPDGLPAGSEFGPYSHNSDWGNTVAIPDTKGGAIVVWSQFLNRSRLNPKELRAQRIDSGGRLLWGDITHDYRGLPIGSALVRSFSYHGFRHAAVPDGEGGAYIFWLDERSPGIYAQHISCTGTALWRENGVPISPVDFSGLSRPVVVADRSGGAIVAWVGTTARDSGVFAVRVTASGRLPWRTPVLVQAASSGIDSLRIVAAQGGAILAWRDTRSSAGENIFAQRIDHHGRLRWGRNGVPVCTAPGHKDYLTAAPDDHGGAYVAWGDTRPAGNVMALHLDRRGEPVRGWTRDGTPVCGLQNEVFAVNLVADETRGAIAVWTESRGTFAMKLLPHSPATPPYPSVAAARLPSKPMQTRAASTVLALYGLKPNPGPSGSLIRFSLPDATPATLELFDVGGRRIWSRDVDHLGAGEHAVRIADGVRLTPGIYLVRLVQGARVARARVAII